MKSVLVLLLVAFSLHAQAEDTEASGTRESSTTSEANRKQSTFSVLANPVGIGPNTTPEQGGIVALFLNYRTLLQIEVSDGNTANGSSWLWGDKGSTTNIHTSTVSLAAKYFLGNTFYIKGGPDYRMVNYKNSDSTTNYYEFNGNSTSISAVIGNQWSWSHFTLGCDWFGITQPISRTFNYEYSNPNNSWTAGDLKNREDAYTKSVSYQAVRFYLGASF